MPLPSDLLAATDADVAGLVDQSESEGPHADFKRDLARLDAAGRHELLADISALANSAGGDLIFGLDEDGEGRAAAIAPLPGNPDEEVRRVQDCLMNGVEPRLPGVQVRAIAVTGGFVLVIRVPQSWAAPHRVRSNQHFYVREGARKRQLDVPEIRAMFLRTEGQAQRVRDFRTDRIGKIIARELPLRLVDGPIVIVHLIPTQAALGVVQVDPVPYVRQRALPALGTTVPAARINLDGALGLRPENGGATHGYSLLFRNGFFESTRVLTGRTERGNFNLPSLAYEQEAIRLIDGFRQELRHLGVGEEMTAMWSLTRANEVELGMDAQQRFFLDIDLTAFDRSALVLPDVLLPAEQTSAAALRPLFDLVWQSAGLAASTNYDAAGNWGRH